MPKRISDRQRVVAFFTSADLAEIETMLDVVKSIVQSRMGPKTKPRKEKPAAKQTQKDFTDVIPLSDQAEIRK